MQEMAIKGTHERVMKVLESVVQPRAGTRVLDVGAGQGAFSKRLERAGLSVSACDVEPEQFQVTGIECRQVGAGGALPYGDATFDLAVAVEVMEHIDGHDRFFAEIARVLKLRGVFLFTTPNILSLKSRMMFLFTGRFYSFPPLEFARRDPTAQHISAFTLDRHAWLLSQHNLRVIHVGTDKVQTTSRLLAFLVPFIKLAEPRSGRTAAAGGGPNSRVALFGRKLVVLARKEERDCRDG